jgi:hypothetical protein
MRSPIGAIMAVAVSGLVSLAGPACADQTLSNVQFRDRFIETIHRLAPKVKVTVVSADQIDLSEPGLEDVRSNLFNAYHAYLVDKSSLDSVTAGYAKLAVESMQPAGAIKIDDLVILIRPRGYLAEIPQEKVVRPLAGDLMQVVAVNKPDSFDIPTLEQISKSIGAPDDKLWARALENTKALIGSCSATKLSEGVIDLECNQGFASSVLLLDEMWVPHKLPRRGAAIVSVGKDDLLVAHAGAPKSVAALTGFLAAHANDPSFLSSTLLVRTETGWATYAPNP